MISPEGCSTILFGSAASAPRAAEQLRLTSADLLALGVVDGVITEPEGDARADHARTADHVRSALLAVLTEFDALGPRELVEQRYKRFARFGDPVQQPRLVEVDTHEGQ
ncbi:predicted protein [Streptomyces iranensis]|uniref:acetyl-CoA carboxytransferase n=1 Tax=Streptomyces iranensis TaxID=576784 RepID=A0A060ZK10_9ACTN|nr:predicted protein [Streptomyces iranensis]